MITLNGVFFTTSMNSSLSFITETFNQLVINKSTKKKAYSHKTMCVNAQENMKTAKNARETINM